MKVFRMNEYDWIAAPSEQEALEFYMKDTGLTEEEAKDPDWFGECNLDKGWMWFAWDDLTEEEKQWAYTDYKTFDGVLCVKRSFRYVLDHYKQTEPYYIASADA